MVQPIKNDSGDVIESAAYGAAKGGATGFIGSFLAGAALTAAVAALAVITVAAIAPVLTVAGSLAATGGLIGGLAIIGGAATAFSYGSVAAGVGALVGLAKGASRAEKQNSAYLAKTREASMGRDAETVALQNQAMQMGFQAGAEQGRAVGQQEGAQMVLAKLQEHAQKAEPAHEHHEHKHEHGHDHAKVAAVAATASTDEAAKKSFVATENQRREAQAAVAAAGAQIS